MPPLPPARQSGGAPGPARGAAPAEPPCRGGPGGGPCFPHPRSPTDELAARGPAARAAAGAAASAGERAPRPGHPPARPPPPSAQAPQGAHPARRARAGGPRGGRAHAQSVPAAVGAGTSGGAARFPGPLCRRACGQPGVRRGAVLVLLFPPSFSGEDNPKSLRDMRREGKARPPPLRNTADGSLQAQTSLHQFIFQHSGKRIAASQEKMKTFISLVLVKTLKTPCM
ncbi:translation initiation factor IF-2-like [Aquila chrysaetos chrysaetos]|uniref:translation initiation factor IF-2-like n=1 Tax=Aquila chrysaetos chrysaetos TaxID=223781 RepID=UPI00117720EF|nr:translation initiation factor IF-2-like [Aquila chrysaetos chrysaetos]